MFVWLEYNRVVDLLGESIGIFLMNFLESDIFRRFRKVSFKFSIYIRIFR